MHKSVRAMKSDRRGAVAMLTVIFVAVVLSIVVTGFIRLSLSNQREAIDDDLTTRAFYAAETGVEAARQELVDYLENGTPIERSECGSPVELTDLNNTGGEAFDAAYTCLLIDVAPNSYIADLEANGRAALVPLRTSTDFDNVTVEWHISDGDGTYSLRSDDSLPQDSDWGDAPSLLRVQAFRSASSGASVDDWRTYNGSGNGPNDITMFFAPQPGAPGNIGGNNLFSGLGQDRDLITPNCVPSQSEGDYACSVTFSIDGGPGNSWSNYLNIRALYKDTTIRVTANAGNNPVEFTDVQAVVDVTGRANDIFRRIETRIPITSVAELEDFAVLSSERLCKDFSITDDHTEYNVVQVTDDNYLCQ